MGEQLLSHCVAGEAKLAADVAAAEDALQLERERNNTCGKTIAALQQSVADSTHVS